MSEPIVCCIMLTRDRPEMVKRAVESFRAQSYATKKLIVLDTSATPIDIEGPHVTVLHWHESNEPCRKTIGALRNTACTYARKGLAQQPDIIAHWDDDDWSHPERLTEQVALLQSSGADCVGYYDMLFWDTRPGAFCGSWLYSNPLCSRYALGTSLMYWRKTWERVPFDDICSGEDARFVQKVRMNSVSSTYGFEQPRMIASIHGGNTSTYKLETAREFQRVPQWDEYCRERMKS